MAGTPAFAQSNVNASSVKGESEAGLPDEVDDKFEQAVDSQKDGEERESVFPLYRDWFEQQGVDLPLPYGVGLMLIAMNRDIEVTDVTVQFLNRPPESIGDRVDFEISSGTRSLAARFDTWVLPFINVYALAGEATTDTSLRTRFEIDRPNAPPLEVEIGDDSSVDGPLLGAGLTAVVGGDAWFGMLDANYNLAELDLFDEEIKAWLYSARLGWHGPTRWGPARAWVGMFYMDSERTLTISEDFPLIGRTEVRVTQRPVNPTTYQVGASLTVDRHWDMLLEAGSNFDDANLVVLSMSYRF